MRFLAVLELFKQGLVELDQVDDLRRHRVIWLGADVDVAEALAGVDVYEG